MNSISLKYRIAFIIFLLEAIMVSLVLWQTESTFSKDIQAKISDKERTMFAIISDICRYSLINSEYAELQSHVQKLEKDPFINSITVADYKNTIVSATDTKFIGQKMFVTTDIKDNHWLRQEISNSAGLLGALSIEFSSLPLRQSKINARKKGIVVAFISMIIIAVVGIITGIILTRRINSLALVTRNIAQGELDVDLDFSGSDEVSSLAHDIHAMSAEIQSQILFLKESEARYHALFNNNHSVMLIIDPSTGDIVDANPAACEFYGYCHVDLTSKKIQQINILSEDELEAERVNAKAENRNNFYFKHRLNDGTIKDVEVYSGPINIKGKPLLYSIVHDITERKRAEESLIISEDRYKKLITNMAEGFALHKIITSETNVPVDYEFIEVNDAYERMTTLKREDVVGKTVSTILPGIENDPGNWIGKFGNVALTGEQIVFESFSAHLNQWYHVAAYSPGKEYFAVIINDITERKRAEEDLLKAHKELEKRVEERTRELKKTHEQLVHAEKLSAIGNLSASIAHEFNNPLQGVMTILKGVSRRTSLDEEDAELMSMAVDECARMRDLIKSLQDFNRPSSGIVAPMNIHASIDSLLMLSKKEYHTKGITVEKSYTKDLPQIKAIADQIKQVILNLLNNAAYACEGGGTITISTDVVDKDQIAIKIHDTGKGIKAEHIDKIFNPFFTTKPAVKGTGLGLSVSYGIIKNHGGRIEVKSEPDKGSTFTVTLPIAGVKNASANSTG